MLNVNIYKPVNESLGKVAAVQDENILVRFDKKGCAFFEYKTVSLGYEGMNEQECKYCKASRPSHVDAVPKSSCEVEGHVPMGHGGMGVCIEDLGRQDEGER